VIEDRLAIVQVVENWAIWRDAGDWERFRTVWHDEGWMSATWFQGPAREFIEVSRAGFEKGVSMRRARPMQVSVRSTNSTTPASSTPQSAATAKHATRMSSSMPPSGSSTTSTITSRARKSKKRSIAIEPRKALGATRNCRPASSARAISPKCGSM